MTHQKTRLGLLLLAVAVLALSATLWNTSRADDKASYASWIGVWDTVAGGSYKYTLTLQQTRRGIYGSYTPGNGQVAGRVYEGVLHLKWSQDGNLKGTAQLKLSEDGKSFTGTVKSDGQNDEHSWNGTRR